MQTIAPDWESLQDKPRVAAAQGVQLQAHTAKGALPALLDMCLTKDEHFRQAGRLAMPWCERALIDYDISFAAGQTVRHLAHLDCFRKECRAAIAELAGRCGELTAVLRRQQSSTVRSVAGKLNLGLLAILAVVARWPDRKVIIRFIAGFRVVGELEATSVFPSRLPREAVSKDVLIAGAEAATERLMRGGMAEDAQALLECAHADHAAKRGTSLFTKWQLDER